MRRPIESSKWRPNRCSARRLVLAVLVALAGLGASGPGAAVIVGPGDGLGNVGPPPGLDLPWQNVGRRGQLTAVYLGEGWILTTDHGAMAEVTLGDRVFQVVPDSKQRLVHPELGPADLAVYRLTEDPGLPALPIAREAPRPGQEVVLLGKGSNRGEAVRGPTGRHRGWRWAPGAAQMRWGTNRVSEVAARVRGTAAFATAFDPPTSEAATAHECQAAMGDSGGPVLVRSVGGWHVMGILFAVSGTGAALYGQQSYAVDLTVYRELIESAVGRRTGRASSRD